MRVMTPHNPLTHSHLNKLHTFRQAAYDCFGRSADALFELGDAVLLTPNVHSFAELSLCPVFRRQWPSLYEALQDGQVSRRALLRLYLAELAHDPRPLLAGDHTAWSRPEARTLRDRTVEHQPNRIPDAKPITVGLGYSTLVYVPQAAGSWALPLLHERIAPSDSPRRRMVRQVQQVCEDSPHRPLVMLDAEYGCAPFVAEAASLDSDWLLRLRPNLRLYTAPGRYKGRGRRPKHGRKFKLFDARTWGKPQSTLALTDPDLGAVQVRCWSGLHFEKAPEQTLWVIRIERVQTRGSRRQPKVLWLAWLGQTPPPLAEWWKLYLRRYAVDHWYRFCKQQLHWTLPRLKTPEQADVWSDLMPLLTWQLWLARQVAQDKPWPWQKPQTVLTPGRVRQSFATVLTQVGTPTRVVKPRGKAVGWVKGRVRRKAERFAVVKKRPKRAP